MEKKKVKIYFMDSSKKVHWKLYFMICLVDSYISWSNKMYSLPDKDMDENFRKEGLFYLCFGMAIAGAFKAIV